LNCLCVRPGRCDNDKRRKQRQREQEHAFHLEVPSFSARFMRGLCPL
jgi:hypothetical protein